MKKTIFFTFFVIFLKSCVFDLDPTKPPLKKATFTFQKFTIRDGSKTITKTQILANIVGKKKDFRIKKIKINHSEIAKIIGEQPNFQIQILKIGKFTAEIILEKEDFLDVKIENCAFEIQNKNVSFQKLTRLLKDGNTITTTQILQQIRGLSGLKYQIKNITISDTSFANVVGTKPNFEIQILKTGNFTANIILEKEGFLDVKIENCAFEIQNKNVSFQKLTRLLKDGNTITTTQILQQIRGLSGLKYQIKNITISDTSFANVVGTKPNFEIQILKIGKFTAEIILEKEGFLDVKIENCAFEKIASNIYFEKFTITNGSRMIMKDQILAKIQGQKNGYQIKSIAISDASFANVGANFEIQILKTGTFTAEIILEKTGFLDVKIENCTFEIQNKTFTFQKLIIRNGNKTIAKNEILAKIQGQKTGYQIKNIAISDDSFANVGANFEIQILKTGNFTAEIILEKTGFLDVKIENCEFQVIPASINVFPITDPRYKDQWYLKNTTGNLDINIEPVWRKGYLGEGIFVGVIDDGLDANHPDLKNNILKNERWIASTAAAGACDKNSHGTPVVGIIAAENNNIGTVGVAPKSKIYFYGYSDYNRDNNKHVDAEVRVRELKKDVHKIAVYNCSWGFSGTGFYVEESLKMHKAFDEGIKNGFGGKGSVYVLSAGNAGAFGTTTNQNGMLSHRGTLAVSGVKKDGNLHFAAAMPGLNNWIAAFVAEVLTSDRTGSCGYVAGDYHEFGGSSAAAPMVAGVVALMREANPNLTYRDVKLILAETAKRSHLPAYDPAQWFPAGEKYSENGVNLQYNRYLGFGMVDATAAVNLAKTWANVPTQKEETYSSSSASKKLEQNVMQEIQIPVQNTNINFIEHIKFTMEFTNDSAYYGFRLVMEIEEPNGRKFKAIGLDEKGLMHFGGLIKGTTKFQTSYNLKIGKNKANGTWKLRFKNAVSGSDDSNINVQNIKMKIYGF